MSVFVLLENINFWKKHQISSPCSFIDNLMKNIKISGIFKQINVTVSRPGNTVPLSSVCCCRYSTHTTIQTYITVRFKLQCCTIYESATGIAWGSFTVKLDLCDKCDKQNKMQCNFLQEPGKIQIPFEWSYENKWVKAIGRSPFVPHTRDGLCNAHFNPSDIITESYTWTIKTTTTTVSDESWL